MAQATDIWAAAGLVFLGEIPFPTAVVHRAWCAWSAAALMCLKKRKLYENQLEAVENNIMRVNEQQMMLENQRTTVETVAALSNAAKASKQTMHEMKIENVDKVLPSAICQCMVNHVPLRIAIPC